MQTSEGFLALRLSVALRPTAKTRRIVAISAKVNRLGSSID
jgi:hypothetical protein